MILGIIGLGIIAGFTAGSTALFAGYSILMSLWFYSLAGCLTVLSGVLLAHTVQSLICHWQRHQAYPG